MAPRASDGAISLLQVTRLLCYPLSAHDTGYECQKAPNGRPLACDFFHFRGAH